MSISFNGSTSKIEHTTATALNFANMTICCWAYAASQGEGSLGRIIQADETAAAGTTGGNGFFYCHNNAADVLRFAYSWSTAAGVWTFPATDSQWNALALTYNRTSTANNPAARVNFAGVTVTRSTAPTGSVGVPSAGYCIGNRTGADRTWNGKLAHLQIFNVVLSSSEQDAACRKPGSIWRGLQAWWPMWTEADLGQYVAAGPAAGTGTDLADGDTHPPVVFPWGGTRGWRGHATAAAAPTGGLPGLAGPRGFHLAGRRGLAA